jgi:hypothetical protein
MSPSASGANGERGTNRPGRNTLLFWATPAVCVLGGAAYLGTLSAGGHPAAGIAALAIMLAAAAAVVFAARYSETVRGLMDHRDERIAGIDLKATAASGAILVLTILVAAMVELARGHSGAPYTWLAAVGGLAYVLSVVVLRARR